MIPGLAPGCAERTNPRSVPPPAQPAPLDLARGEHHELDDLPHRVAADVGPGDHAAPARPLIKSARPLSAWPNKSLPANSLLFPPGGGLGLFVSLGVASFRNVTIEPIRNEN